MSIYVSMGVTAPGMMGESEIEEAKLHANAAQVTDDAQNPNANQ